MKENVSIINSTVESVASEFHILDQPPSSKSLLFHPVKKQPSTNILHASSPVPTIETKTVDEILAETVLAPLPSDDAHDAFFVADMGEVVRQYQLFRRLLPRIVPFFAIKCNPDINVIKKLHSLGTGFDCASKAEIETVLNVGAAPTNIIYANPCKQASHIRFASSVGVDTMTFDNEDELEKIARLHPNAALVLRILADDSRSLCKFGVKFGASIDRVPALLAKARELGSRVIGISFHVGSGCYDACAFAEAVVLARRAFDIGVEFGFEFELLDVGGGFPGQGSSGITFEAIASSLGPTVDALFPPHVKVIAEPGRYFVSSAYTLACNITSKRAVPRDIASGDSQEISKDDHPSFMYYINDGVYGSFNCIMFDHYKPQPKALLTGSTYHYERSPTGPKYACSIWGPTCDSMDCITRREEGLPEMEVGDWIYFSNMGAYTCAAASCFNGFRKSRIIYTDTEA